MDKTYNKILDLIKNNNSFNEMMEKLNITNVQLQRRIFTLQTEGYNIQRSYCSNGNVFYHLDTNLSSLEKSKNMIELMTTNYQNCLNAMVISDPHMGSEAERKDLLDKIYNYCAAQGISIIFIAGDLIDGMHGKLKKNHNSYYEQIDYALKEYPYDKGILNLAVLGNHDIDSLYNEGLDFKSIIERRRNDIVPIAYGDGLVKIKSDYVLLHHPLSKEYVSPKLNINPALILNGHKHMIHFKNNRNCCEIDVSSISDLNFSNTIYRNTPSTLPGAMEIHIEFNHDYFKKIVCQQIVFTPQLCKINSITHTYETNTNEFSKLR